MIDKNDDDSTSMQHSTRRPHGLVESGAAAPGLRRQDFAHDPQAVPPTEAGRNHRPYTLIEEKELTDSLEKILEKGGLKSSGFFMEDMSRQTKKENAFLAGLGRTRRVVLGDNLLKNMTFAEIESIIAHEVGHFKHKHIWKQMTVGTFTQLTVFLLLDLLF